MKYSLLYLLLFISQIVKSNDFPVTYSLTGHIFPTRQNTIEIDKEILKFTLNNDHTISTSVYFEFYNPTDSIINLDIAFVDAGWSIESPHYEDGKWRRYIDETMYDFMHTIEEKQELDHTTEIAEGPYNNIYDFKVFLEGKELNYEIKLLGKAYEEFGYKGNEILYIFKASFPPGKTVIEHSYELENTHEHTYLLEYILRSGKQWANGKINDFTLEFHLGEDNECIYFPIDSFLQKSNFLQESKLITNDNKVLKFNGNIYEGTFMQFKKKDFIPNENIETEYELCESEPLYHVSEMPIFGECKDNSCTEYEIMKFISKNFKYPESAKKNPVIGRVILEFVVESDGKVGRVKILKGLDKYLAAENVIEEIHNECIRIINSLPQFVPARNAGIPWPVKYRVPIKLG